MKYDLDAWVVTRSGDEGKVVGYVDRPSYILHRPDGSRVQVSAEAIQGPTAPWPEPYLAKAPLREDAQRAMERWFAERHEEVAEVLGPFGISPMEVEMPVLMRVFENGQ